MFEKLIGVKFVTVCIYFTRKQERKGELHNVIHTNTKVIL
jgi:hypothetical protein